jgi:hypothetical protein
VKLPWDVIEEEVQGAYLGAGAFPLRPYSEYMPPPYVGLKPAAPAIAAHAAGCEVHDRSAFEIDEYEQAHDLEPGLDQIARCLASHLVKLVRGAPHALSRTMLDANPAWPAELAAAAAAGALAHDPVIIISPIALSRTQNDKGVDRWTLFGGSHDGPTVRGLDEEALLAWAGIDRSAIEVLVTFTPFAELPRDVRDAYLAGTLVLVPSPASLVLFEHVHYKKLSAQLPRARQIALLHLFPRIEEACAIRIPQSGWIDELDRPAHGHHVKNEIIRTHRWQRVARDSDVHGDGAYTDKVATALFSTTPEAIDLYDKPLARNAQVWTADYELLLDGPRAGHTEIAHAAGVVDRGGRFGYRMYYPPMRAGLREVFWHVPVIARADGERYRGAPTGHITAERDGHAPLVLSPDLIARQGHRTAARSFPGEQGVPHLTTSSNARKLLEARQLLGSRIPPSYARSLLRIAKPATLDGWLAELPAKSSDRAAAEALVAQLREGLGPEDEAGLPIVLHRVGTRAFEERVWTTIRALAHGAFRMKNDADGILVNRGRHGGAAALAARVHVHQKRDLEALGDHLHERYRELIALHGLEGQAEVVDHVFRWESDHHFEWMEGWVRNQVAPAERNIILMIPGRDRRQAVVMGDHYDTAYMEDVFYGEKGGDFLRAPAAGADDNHSATTALLLAAEQLLPLAAAGKLARDVWLVHLTGEEYPADCMGARALGQALVEKSLVLTAEDGTARDVSQVTVVGAFILDMIGHNTERNRDVFMIAPGEGTGSAHLALRAHHANRRWNASAAAWNQRDDRRGLSRAERVPDGPHPSPPPPPFAHLPLSGEVRVEWEPRSALFNTDGQIFSDLGIPCVLFMENYDINRTGYHDTHDTMANIDLDYCAAMIAIAIETVADTACTDRL